MKKIKKDSGIITDAQDKILETKIKDFSDEASIEFTNSLKNFSKDLYNESIDTANRYTSALVSPTDVEHARRFLYRIPKKQEPRDVFFNEVPIPLGFAFLSIAFSLVAEIYLDIIKLDNLDQKIWIPILFFGAGCFCVIVGIYYKFKPE